MYVRVDRRVSALSIALLIAVICASWSLSPLLFLTLSEATFVAVAYAAFVMAWNLRRFSADDFFLFVSRALMVVGVLHLLRAVTYPGVGIVPAVPVDLSLELDLAAGLVAGVGFCLSPVAIGRRLHPRRSMWLPWVLGALVILALTVTDIVPAVSAHGTAPTRFAQVAALGDALLLVCALAGLVLRRLRLPPGACLAMVAAIALMAGYYASLVAWQASGEAVVIVRHVLLILSALFIYRAIVQAGLARPMELTVDGLERQRRAADSRWTTLVEQSPMGVFVFDDRAGVIAANRHAEAIFGAGDGELTGASLREAADPRLIPCIEQALAGSPSGYEGPCRSRRSGQELWLAVRAAPLAGADEGQDGCLAAVVNLTESKQSEQLIEQLTFRDPLTGLANRSLLRDRLSQALRNADRTGQHVAVVAVDLDRFKQVNDRWGQAFGDELLVAAAARLAAVLRADDTAARAGGNEFMLVLPGIRSGEDAVTVAEKVADAMRQPWRIAAEDFHLTSSTGVALYPDDADRLDTLIERAHAAMLRAKQEGGAACQYFSASMNTRADERIALESDLRQALVDGKQLDVFYQPQVSLADGRLVGLEALVRWRHPSRGLLTPDAFVPLAETVGLIDRMDRLVLRKACRQVARLRRESGLDVRLAVNVSGREFRRADLAETVQAALSAAGLRPEDLELEVTETTAITDIDRVRESMESLRVMGVSLALDDFGTGFSSLVHMRDLPVCRLKIDKSFVAAMADDVGTAAIVAAVVALGRSLGVKVLAEGVETSEEADALRALGCDEAQGYLYAKPMARARLRGYLRVAAEVLGRSDKPPAR